ncbi:ENR1 protein, partial [Chunga burmeisteri]|nr:ENR1 protein [Chunga burmeisteri]
QLTDIALPGLGQNLFIDLMQSIIGELNVFDCWICGGALMTEEWPWRGTSLNVIDTLRWNRSEITKTENRPEGWMLSSEVVADECIRREG